MVIEGIFIFCLCLISCSGQGNLDKITSLPNLKGKLGNQYSGYLVVDETAGRHYHYWFVESETDPLNAPLVLWLNGGPGCSSLDGFFYEHGPFKFDQTSSTPSLVPNPYSWNKVANVLYLESPAGVGFTYSNSQSDYLNQNDTRTANDNYQFLKLWYQKYPQYLKNDFWITGESYAGIYVPSLAQVVLKGVLSKEFVIPFKGIMVGNGLSNSVGATDLIVNIDFLWGHGIISRELYLQIQKACTADPSSPTCNNLESQAYNNMNNIDIYDLYTDCYHQRPAPHKPKLTKQVSSAPPCTDAYYATLYLNDPVVKSAIHVNPGITWSICSDIVNAEYDRATNSMVPIHQFLYKNGLTILIYSGDADFAVPYTDSAYWTANEMGLAPTSQWRQWNFGDGEGTQVAGFVSEYGPRFSFATVKGAGHMVPQFAPNPALVMFNKTLHGLPL